jgi:uncharacterized protein
MDDETLAAYIQQYIEASTDDVVWFTWHGGEPTLAGLSFFQRVIRWQRMFADGRTIRNALQTNGRLINSAWCEFLQETNWLVGLSIDGTKTAHDHYRLIAKDKGSYEFAFNALKLLQQYRIEVNGLVTINKANVAQPLETYRHLRSLGITYLQFLPLAKSTQSSEKKWHITGHEYGEFLTAILKEWLLNDVGKITIQDFESAYSTLKGLPATACAHGQMCGHSLVVLKGGEVYTCEHFIGHEHYLGNIHIKTLSQLRLSTSNVTFGVEKTLNLADKCKQCPFLKQCQGGCSRHRVDEGVNVLCEGYMKFFNAFNQVFDKPQPDVLA